MKSGTCIGPGRSKRGFLIKSEKPPKGQNGGNDSREPGDFV
jgi:hypothetical protein